MGRKNDKDTVDQIIDTLINMSNGSLKRTDVEKKLTKMNILMQNSKYNINKKSNNVFINELIIDENYENCRFKNIKKKKLKTKVKECDCTLKSKSSEKLIQDNKDKKKIPELVYDSD